VSITKRDYVGHHVEKQCRSPGFDAKTGNFGTVDASDLEPNFLRLRKGKDAVPI
jgi:hypothetical protein